MFRYINYTNTLISIHQYKYKKYNPIPLSNTYVDEFWSVFQSVSQTAHRYTYRIFTSS